MVFRFSIVGLLASLFLFACQQPNSSDDIGIRPFQEKHRPQFHFSPPTQWMNDPNGMVYWNGEYHLFYQHFPDSNVWGPMHWGHAKSEDLIYWEHQEIALFPDSLGYIFSGSVVADIQNTSGLGIDNQTPLVAIFSYHHPEREAQGTTDYQSQGLAFSIDEGKTWSKYPRNPVLLSPGVRDFRDPKVFWYEPSNTWIMSLAVLDKISFYSSPNLIDWSHLSDFSVEWANFEGVWECPDLFPLTAPDGSEKWVLLVSINPGGPLGGSATQYFIGDFNGKEFTVLSNRVLWLDHGTDNYAGVTWSNIPAEDGRTIFIGWMSNWEYAQVVPTTAWRSAMTLPRSLSLFGNGESLRLASFPIEEIHKLKGTPISAQGNSFPLQSDILHLSLLPKQEDFSIEWSNSAGNVLRVYRDGDKIAIDRSLSGITDFNNLFSKTQSMDLEGLNVEKMDVFLDKASIELFINDGQRAMTAIFFPDSTWSHFKCQGVELPVKGNYFRSIW